MDTPTPSPSLRRLGAALQGLVLAVPLVLLALLLAGAARAEETAAAPSACVPTQSAVPRLEREGRLAALEAEADAEPNGVGRLWRIEREGVAPSVLFGTMHLTDPRLQDLPPEADRALADAHALVIETTDILDPAIAGRAMLTRPDLVSMPAGRRLADLLPAGDLARVLPALEAQGMPAGAVDTLQPWFLATALLLTPCEAERIRNGGEVLDLSLASRAKAAGKPVEGLESAAEQMAALASLSLEAQAKNLVATVATRDEMPAVLETMTDLYLQGRIALIGPVIEAVAPSGTSESDALEVTRNFEDRVIRQRNTLMDQRLQPLLREGGRFVAVGALHLPGADGLVELLRRGGWRVTPLAN